MSQGKNGPWLEEIAVSVVKGVVTVILIFAALVGVFLLAYIVTGVAFGQDFVKPEWRGEYRNPNCSAGGNCWVRFEEPPDGAFVRVYLHDLDLTEDGSVDSNQYVEMFDCQGGQIGCRFSPDPCSLDLMKGTGYGVVMVYVWEQVVEGPPDWNESRESEMRVVEWKQRLKCAY